MKNRLLSRVLPVLAGSALLFPLSGCNVELKDNAREVETLQTVNSSLKAQNEELGRQNAELKSEVERMAAEVLASQEQVKVTEQEMFDLKHSGPPEPPKTPYEYDVGLVTTVGDKMVLTNVTFGKDQQALHTRIADADVFWDFAAIDTLRRTGKPRDRWMPVSIYTRDHQEIHAAVLDYFLAGENSNGERVAVAIVDIQGMKVQRRYVPENDPDPDRVHGYNLSQKAKGETGHWWKAEAGAMTPAE